MFFSTKKILKKKVKRLAILLLLLQLTFINTPFQIIKPVEAQTAKPNIVFIMMDDLEAQPATLDTMTRTKQLIANLGIVFKNATVPVALCCPSRISINTGQYVHNHDVINNQGIHGGYAKFLAGRGETNTLALNLQGAGYKTQYIGKYINGYPGPNPESFIPPGWDKWFGVMGIDYYNYKVNDNGQVSTYGNNQYASDVFTDEALNFIQQQATSTTPFFITLDYFTPHGPATPAPRHAGLFNNYQAPRNDSFNEADISDKPQFLKDLAPLTAAQITDIDNFYRDRLRSLQAADEGIEKIINKLNQVGKLNNTYIIFTSDNGFHLGDHRLGYGKMTAYENAVVVPLYIRGPGISAGIKTQPVSTLDFMPTFLELAQSTVNRTQFDGRSLVPLLGGGNPQWRRSMLIERLNESQNPLPNNAAAVGIADFDRYPNDQTINAFVNEHNNGALSKAYKSIRTPTFKYTEYITNEKEAYNLAGDPYELNNIYNTLTAAQKTELATALNTFKTCAGSSCRQADLYSPSWLTTEPTNTPIITPTITPTQQPTTPTATPIFTTTPTPPPTGCTTKNRGNADCRTNASGKAVDILDYALWYQEYIGGCSSTALSGCGGDSDGNGNMMDANFNFPGSGHIAEDTQVNVYDYAVWIQGYTTQ